MMSRSAWPGSACYLERSFVFNRKIYWEIQAVTLTIAILLVSSRVMQAAKQPDLAARIDAIVRPAFPSDQPGAAVIVVKECNVIYRKAYGTADLELGVPLAPD